MANIFEINKLSDCIQRLSDENITTTKKLVEGRYYSVHEYACNSHINEIINLGTKLGFIKTNGDLLELEKDGVDFLSLLEGDLEPTKTQISLLEKKLTSVEFIQDFEVLFSECYVDHSGQTPFWRLKSEKYSKRDFIQFLQELNFLERFQPPSDEIGLFIPVEKNHLASYLKNRSKFSKKDYFKTQQTKTKVGKEGERLTMEYEMDRLQENEDLQDRILQVSIWDDNIGYDIESFRDARSTKFDMHIEVKATQDTNPHFYLTSKEKKVAEQLGSEYYIYLWTNVWVDPKVKIIRDPYDEIFIKSKDEPIVDSYFINKKLIDGIRD